MKLKDKVVIITGASSGIGKALAIEFAQRGVNLVLAARQYVTLCGIAQQLQTDYNIKAIAVQCDVAVEDDCAALVKQTLLTFGKIDVLVNNAGISMRALFKDVDLQVMKNLMDVNFWGTVYCTKHALPAIIKTHGSIVGISSIAGYKGLPGRAGYSASKYAMNGFLMPCGWRTYAQVFISWWPARALPRQISAIPRSIKTAGNKARVLWKKIK